MYFSRMAGKIVAFVMLVLTLNVMMTGFAPRGASSGPSMAGISSLVSSQQITDNDPEGLADFKPPKNSFVDYGTYFGGSVTVPAYRPSTALMTFGNTFRFLPTIYTDIPVPPIIA